MEPVSGVSAASISPSLLMAERWNSARGAERAPSPEDVKKVAKQFEAILVRQLLAPAVEPMMSQSMDGSSASGGGVYGYMLSDVLANSISQGGGLGLADILESQLSPRAASAPATEHHASNL